MNFLICTWKNVKISYVIGSQLFPALKQSDATADDDWGDDSKHNDYDDDECDDADNNCEYNENDVLLQRNAHCKRRRLGDKSGCADVWVKGPPLPFHVLHISKFSPCFTYFKATIFFIFSSARIFYISPQPAATSTAEKIQVIYNPKEGEFYLRGCLWCSSTQMLWKTPSHNAAL